MKFGIIADDNTGATDAAGMLTERGVRTVLFINVPEANIFAQIAPEYDAAVIDTCARSIPPKDACHRTAEAVKLLTQTKVEKIQIKYCSTFDSTPDGNIGPTLDAAMDLLQAEATIVSPALPVNGRTTYCGHHFVNGQLLSESPLKDHPLNPMTDANLVRWLQMQTARKVSLAPLAIIRKGPKALEEFLCLRMKQGDAYFVTDTIEQSDLAIIAHATAEWPLISGGSGITAEIPGLLFPGERSLSFSERLSACSHRTFIVSGSCSPATREQNAFALANGFVGLQVSGNDILEEQLAPNKLIEQASREFTRGKNILLSTSSDPTEVRRVQEHGKSMGLTVTDTSEKIAGALAELAARLVERGEVGRLIISGGETSGAVCRRLGVSALEVGLPIDPGVPYCFPIRGPEILMALKSGNFGAKDLYLKVQKL